MNKFKIVITLLVVAIICLTLYIAFNLTKLAQESGQLVKVYQQAQR